MPKAEAISLDETEILHPNPTVRWLNLLGGTAVIVVSVLSIFHALGIVEIFGSLAKIVARYGFGQLTVEAIVAEFGARRGVPPQDAIRVLLAAVSIIVFLFFYVRYLIAAMTFGFSRIGRGLLQWRNTGVPHGVPHAFPDPSAVMQKMIRREKYFSSIKSTDLSTLFGLNAQYLSPMGAWAAQTNFRNGRIGWVGATIKPIVLMVILGSVVAWLDLQAPGQFDLVGVLASLTHSAGLWAILAGLLFPLSLIALAPILFAIIDYTYVSLMIPRRMWPADSVSRVDKSVASVAPNMIHHEFPSRMENHRSEDEPNFVYPLASEIAATSVGETGNFTLIGLIEQHPVAVENPNAKAMRFRLAIGWGLFLVGVGVVLFALWPTNAGTSFLLHRLPAPDIVVAPFVQIALAIFAARLIRRGRAMISEAETMYESHWFKSEAVAFQMRGTTAKSEIKIGGKNDTIGSTSIVYRSEFLHDITAATLYSEVVNLEGHRALIATAVTSASQALLESAEHELRKVIESKAAPISVDLGHPDLQGQIELNLSIEAHRAGRVESAKLEAQRAAAAQQLPTTPPAPPLPGSGEA